MDQFVSLHTHTEYSVLDGAAKLEDMAAHLRKIGQTAVSQTDHGHMHGAYEFYRTMTKAGIKPILGIEAYISPRHHTEKTAVYLGEPEQKRHDIAGQGAYTHMTILAKNEVGLRNLFKLHTLSYTEGFYRKPRMSLDMIAPLSEGLIATTGCAGGFIPVALRVGRPDLAVAHLARLTDIFKGELYVEVMEHGITDDGTDGYDEAGLNRQLLEFATQWGLRPVATNDSHYVRSTDAQVHDSLLCVQTRAKISDVNRFRFSGAGYHLATRAEMDRTSLPREALDTTVAIAAGVEGYEAVFEKRLMMPGFTPPADWKPSATA